METIVNSMLDDLVTVLEPRWCRVLGLFAPRGGVGINVSAVHQADERDREVRHAVKAFMRDAAARGGRLRP